jgi:hypothetical protein
VEATLASDVSERVLTLIAQHHEGDRCAAARRLGIGTGRLTGLLSGDWRRFTLDALAALVRVYGVSPAWLLAPRATRACSSACPRVAEPRGVVGRSRNQPPLRTTGVRCSGA